MATTKKENAAPGASKQENEVITSQTQTILPPSVHEFEDEGLGILHTLHRLNLYTPSEIDALKLDYDVNF